MRIKDGKEERAQEWIAFLQEHGNKKHKNEKSIWRFIFNQENGAAYAYMFMMADDLVYHELQKAAAIHWMLKHMEYVSVCVDLEDCTQLSPVLAGGIFLCFIRKNDKSKQRIILFCDGPFV
ncbi:MAG: DUF6176 family protein [Enterocloster clostridioformis]